MNEEAAFLRAIVEQPQEDTPRLVYADWLDENGQPEKAEFIRVQVELERDGDSIELDRYRSLKRREMNLLAANGPVWQQPKGVAEIAKDDDEFIRGLQGGKVEGNVDMLPDLLARLPAESCRVRRREGEDILDALEKTQALSKCRELKFDGCGLDNDDLIRLGRLPTLGGLQALDLTQNMFDDEGVHGFLGAPLAAQLKDLTLQYQYIDPAYSVSPQGFRALFDYYAQNGGLERLRIAVTSPETLTLLRESGLTGKLKELELQFPLTPDVSMHAAVANFVEKSDFHCLEKLGFAFGQEPFGPAQQWIAQALGENESLSGLRHLALPNYLRDNGAKVLSRAENMHNLQSLDVTKGSLNTAGLQALLSAAHLKNLRELNIQQNPCSKVASIKQWSVDNVNMSFIPQAKKVLSALQVNIELPSLCCITVALTGARYNGDYSVDHQLQTAINQLVQDQARALGPSPP